MSDNRRPLKINGLKAIRVTLLVGAAATFGFGLLMAFWFNVSAELNQRPMMGEPVPFIDELVTALRGLGVAAAGLGALVALVDLVAAWGLGRGGGWAWWLTLVLALAYLPSACFPVGIVLLFLLFTRDVREAVKKG